MNGYFYVLTAIDLFVLCFMCVLTHLSESLNKKQKCGFFLAFALIAIISLLEVVTLLVDRMPVQYRYLNILSNYLGFGLSPVVSICLAYVLDKKVSFRKEIIIALFSEIVYLIFLALSIPKGLIFSVSENNIYSRGPYFYIYIIVYFLAIIYLSISTIIIASQFQNHSKKLIYPLFLFMMVETIIQIALPELHVTWLCVTLLSVLYFIYCNEMWNQLDELTGLLNQNSYLHRTSGMSRTKGVLVVFDVDNFKLINDKYGHLKGDISLTEIADCIKKAYEQYGYCYRIGGDEFCVILENNVSIVECTKEFLRLLEEKRETYSFIPTVSFGSSSFDGEDIITIKERADQEMYHYKNERKRIKKQNNIYPANKTNDSYPNMFW